MLIGVVSDTHGHMAGTLAAVRMLESFALSAVLHCGDIGSAEVVRQFRGWPTHFVFGNCDHDRASITAAIGEHGLMCHGRFGELTIGAKKIALLHGDDRHAFDTAIQGGQYDLVCYGHTHVARQERHGGALVLNPGALYRAQPHSLAVVDLVKLDATIIPL